MKSPTLAFLGLAKKTFFFQNVLSWFVSKQPPILEHNLAKYNALKKAFYLTALENLEGDYYEFGVFTGSSFVFAARFHKKMNNGQLNTKFYGFDSFEGFGEHPESDEHPFYNNDTFTINPDKVIKNIKKKTSGLEVHISKGFFEHTLKGKSGKVRVAFIDCDMKQPAVYALRYIRDGLHPGSILVMDDFFSYRGSDKLGVAGAFYDFQADNPHISFRKLFDYGYGEIGRAHV